MTKVFCDVWECKYNREYRGKNESRCIRNIVHFARYGSCKDKPKGECGKKRCIAQCKSVDLSSEGNPNIKE